MGACNFFCRSMPRTQFLLKALAKESSNTEFNGSEEVDEAVRKLKVILEQEGMTFHPIPDFNEEYMLVVDSSLEGFGAVFGIGKCEDEKVENFRPVAFVRLSITKWISRKPVQELQNLTSGFFVCYAKTGRLLETKTGNFNFAKNPKALQSPILRTNLLESSWKSPYPFQSCALTRGINGEKHFSRNSADQISQPSFSTRRSDSQILRLDRAIR
jgi:hypothetical protein